MAPKEQIDDERGGHTSFLNLSLQFTLHTYDMILQSRVFYSTLG